MTLVKIGVQMVINAALGKMANEEEKASTRESMGENALAAGFKAIAQLGPIYGTLAFIAAIGAIMALAGGFREYGGPVVAGMPYIVGEKRPEVFVPNTSGTIVPSIDQFDFARRQPGLAQGQSVGAAGGTTRAAAPPKGENKRWVFFTGDLASIRQMKRDPGWDTAVIDVVMRNRGVLLEG